VGLFRILAATPGFFPSTWFLMLPRGAISPKLNVPTIGYVDAMLVKHYPLACRRPAHGRRTLQIGKQTTEGG